MAIVDMRRLWDLDPDVVFLNHGSYGACPRPVLDHQTKLRRHLERRPVQFLSYDLEALLDAARNALATFVSADPAGVAFVTNATTAVNAIVGSMRFHPGDEIVITDHGYNACRNVVDHAAGRSGAVVRSASVPFTGLTPDAACEAVLAAVGARTRLVIVDHVTSPTALVLPVARIAAELEPRSVPLLIDGAHGPGMLPVDIAAIGASYYVGNCHKWMCAPKGSGFLYAAAGARNELTPTVISHGLNSPRTDRSRFHLLFDWTGTTDPTAHLSVPRALEVMGSLFPGGWDELRRQNRALALQGRRIVADAIGAGDLPGDDMVGSMAAISLAPLRVASNGRDRDPLTLLLRDQYRIEVPVSPWPQAPGRVLRLSAQAYNRVEDYERLAAALAAEGVRAAP